MYYLKMFIHVDTVVVGLVLYVKIVGLPGNTGEDQ